MEREQVKKDFPTLGLLIEDIDGDIDDKELEKLIEGLAPRPVIEWVRNVHRSPTPSKLMEKLPVPEFQLLEHLDHMGRPEAYTMLQDHLLDRLSKADR